MQHYLEGKNFNGATEVKSVFSNFFSSQPASFYRYGIDNLIKRWNGIIENNGEYFID
jgi:hypothetical protein